MKIYSRDREKPLALFNDFSVLDELSPQETYRYTVKRHEYYVVQLLVCEAEGPLRIDVQGFPGKYTVFNTQGVDKYGVPFEKDFSAVKDRINPVYIGFNFDGFDKGTYSAQVLFDGAQCVEMHLMFTVTAEEADDHGYGNIRNLSRLNWLNSTRAQDDSPTTPFTPVVTDGTSVEILGRKIRLGKDLLPEQVESYFDQGVNLTETVQAALLSAPVTFSPGVSALDFSPVSYENRGGYARFTTCGECAHMRMTVTLIARCEGNFEYFTEIEAKEDCEAHVELKVPISQYAAKYNYGFGKKGGRFGGVSTNWNDLRYDSMYVGNINSGVMIRLKAEDYRNPLVNIYYHDLPIVKPETTWDNHASGTMSVQGVPEGAVFSARTGRMVLKKGEKRVFRYEFFFTPFKYIDYKKHFATRYYQSNSMGDKEYDHLKRAEKHGLNVVTVHHGNALNPYINYPFIAVERLKAFVRAAREKGMRVSLYYTAREMSNHTAEVFCYKALGNEIILRQNGEGLTTFKKREWLNKYFGTDVIPAWQVHYRSGEHKGDHDIAFIIQPDSRIENYYIEGLQWLVDNVGISGIYIDDTSLNAVTLRRAKKVLAQTGGLIDMHMWNHEEARAGDAACMNIYTELFPFLDSVWVGEGFDCRKLSAEYIFTEVSGLSYGNTSQMLEGGGNPYVGMLYAMTNRYGWGVSDTHLVYRVWDAFGIENAEMLGYWHDRCPLRTDNSHVLVTCYVKKDAILAAVYNFSQYPQEFCFEIAPERLDFDPADASVSVYAVEKQLFKKKKTVSMKGKNRLGARDGVLFTLEKRQ